MKKNLLRWVTLVCVLSAIVLMALPIGVRTMWSGSEPGERIERIFSYLHPYVWAYGNWFPLLTAIFSVLSVIFLIRALYKKIASKPALVCSVIGVVLSIVASFGVFSVDTITGIIIAVLLCVSVILQILHFLIL